MSSISENSVPVTEFDYTALMNEFLSVNSHLENIEEWQTAFSEFLQEKYPELTDEEIAAIQEEELQEQEYKDELLDSLRSIEQGIGFQTILLEENNRMLKESLSVSENTVSQNSIMTTGFKDYTLSEQLMLLLVLLVFLFGLVFVFTRK